MSVTVEDPGVDIQGYLRLAVHHSRACSCVDICLHLYFVDSFVGASICRVQNMTWAPDRCLYSCQP